MSSRVLAKRQKRRDPLPLLQWQQVDDGLAATDMTGLWQLVNLQPVNFAPRGKAQQGIVRIGHEYLVDEILLLDLGRRLTLAATPLRLIISDRLRFGISTLGHGNHHVGGCNQILV